MPHAVSRTVTIGLGGTGCAAVLNVKRRLMRIFGEIPPTSRFLVFDTDESSARGGNGHSGEAGLERSEFVQLSVDEPVRMIKENKEVRAWWTGVPARTLTNLQSGAKQMRPLGRLAVFANPRDVCNSVRAAIDSVRGLAIGRIAGDKYDLTSNNVTVNIVGSIAGGTGSGTFLDVSFIAKNLLRGHDKLNAYILLPNIFLSRPASFNVEPNTYGALKEIDHFINHKDDQAFSAYKLGGQEIKIEGSIWNVVYLVNNSNRDGLINDSIEDMTEFLGTGIFLSAGSTGDAQKSVFDNIEAAFLGHPGWRGMRANYCSYGISEVVFPKAETKELLMKQLALRIAQQVCSGGKVLGVDDVDNLIDELGIREDTADQVIQAVIPPDSFRKFPMPGEYNKSAWQEVIARRTSHLEEVKRQLSDIAEANSSRLKEEKKEEISKRVHNSFNQAGGLPYTSTLLTSLIGRLEEASKMMKEEHSEESQRLKSIQARYKTVEEQANKDLGKLIGARRAIEQDIRQFKALVDQEAACLLEIERRIRAVEFFATLIAHVQSHLNVAEVVTNRISSVIEHLSNDIQGLRRLKKRIKPFIIELSVADIADYYQSDAALDEFIAWLRVRRVGGVAAFCDISRDNIEEVLFEYALHQPIIAEIDTKTIEDILLWFKPTERYRIVSLLDEAAVPLWSYSHSRIADQITPEETFIIGVYDNSNTILKSDLEYMKKMDAEGGSKVTIVSTGDPLRITFFRAEAALPACVITDIERYREKYLQSKGELSFHVHRDWAEKLADLFPAMSEDENRKYFALGLAEPFNIIKRSGTHYKMESRARGRQIEDYLVDLAQGRVEAMKAFLKDEELVDEARQRIEQITRQMGEEQTVLALQKYVSVLTSDVKRKGSTDEIKEQVEKELHELDDYIHDLTSLS